MSDIGNIYKNRQIPGQIFKPILQLSGLLLSKDFYIFCLWAFVKLIAKFNTDSAQSRVILVNITAFLKYSLSPVRGWHH